MRRPLDSMLGSWPVSLLALGPLLGLALVAAVTFTGLAAVAASHQAQARVEAAREHARRLAEASLVMTTDLGRYLITGDSSMPRSVGAAREQVAREGAAVQALSAEQPGVSARVDEILAVSGIWWDEIGEPVLRAPPEARDAAFRPQRGRELFLALSAAHQNLTDDLQALTNQHRDDIAAAMQRTALAAALVLLAELALLALLGRRLSRLGHLLAERTDANAQLQARIGQQAAVAALGQHALTQTDLPVFLQEATQIVAKTLAVEYTKVLELLPDGQALRLVAGVGWREGLVGRTTVTADRASQAGYTLLADAPVIVADVHTETRFSAPPLLREHGVISGLSIPIRGASGIWGVLGAHTATARAFTDDDASFLQAVAHVIASAVDRNRAETALRQSAAQFRQLTDNIREVFWLSNVEKTQVIFISRGYEGIWGRTCESVYESPRSWIEAIHPDDRPRVLRAATEQQALGTYREEYRIVRPDGTIRWIADRAFPVRDAAGTIYRIAGIAEDITERRQTEAALRESEARYRRLMEDASDAIFLADADGYYVDVNTRACELLGFRRDELLGRHIAEVMAAEDLAATPPRLPELRAGQVLLSERRLRRKDGTLVPVEISAKQLQDGRLQAIVRDITGRKRAEEEQQKLVALIENSTEFIGVADMDRRCIFLNKAGRALVGLQDASAAYLATMTIVDFVHPDSRDHLHSVVLPALERQGFWRGELAFRHVATDEPISVEVTAFVVRQPDSGEPLCLAAVARDIRDRAAAERQRQALAEADKLRALGQMASGVAHDLNNMLTPVLGYSELLLREPALWNDREQGTRFLELINAGALGAADVIRRLNEFYRQRQTTDQMQPVELNALVEEIILLTRPKWHDQTQERGRTIAVQTDLQTVPPIAGQVTRLMEALTNLVFNAVDAMPEGGTLTLRTRARGEQVLVEVVDTGTGMTPEARRRCLEPFFTTKGEHGTGLGLPMVYGIVQQHQGTLDIESAPGRGTRVVIGLPVADPTTPAARVESPARPARSLHVLVVDDQAGVRAVTTQYLAADGHTVEVASDGQEALETFAAGRFDLVVTDQAMPGMSGEQLALAIKQVSPDTPVILLTGFGELMAAADQQLAGVDRVVSKPVTLATWRQALATTLTDTRARA